jgi:hypothetical protein
MLQGQVGVQSNTRSHKTCGSWFKKLSKLVGNLMRSEIISGKFCGPGHIVQVDESKFSRRKFEVGRLVLAFG